MNMRKVEGTVLTLRCSDGEEFAYFEFFGENDVQTWQLGSLCSLSASEVMIAEMTEKEWNDLRGRGGKEFEHRISSKLGRTDLRYVQLIRVQKNDTQEAGIAFQDFLKSYTPPTCFYSCPRGSGESHVTDEMTPSAFIAAGGKITIFGNLVVHEAERSWQS